MVPPGRRQPSSPLLGARKWLQAGASDLPGLSFLLPQVCHSECAAECPKFQH